ncbi:hypothetical protein [Microbulbifer sp. ARAS458-1]|uniref:hypothetical protein n=1 Tax=Microbulbifer sp. ARAS458-1 TaxID=3140242 RepID=UPI0038781966
MIVLDPALGPEGGHHVALLERVHSALESGECSSPVEFYSSRKIRKSLERFATDQIRITPFFDTNFYRYSATLPNIAEANGFIAALGKEYLAALKRVFTESVLIDEADPTAPQRAHRNGKLIIFYPAMQWVHLMAVQFALRLIGSAVSGHQVEHRVCLMYNPGRNHTGEVMNVAEWLSYKMACKSIAAYASVKLYASDYELAEHFGRLLELDSPLPLHPQYLAEMGDLAAPPAVQKSGKKIGIYFGDAKSDKGFNRLPELLEQVIPTIGADDQVVIQYTSQGNCPRVLAAEEKIRKFAQGEPRLSVISRYLPAEEIQAILFSLDVFVFTYDVHHYQNKSSGFLWLLADKSCQLIFLGESWLSREATRLRLNVCVCAFNQLSEVLQGLFVEGRLAYSEGSKNSSSAYGGVESEYRERLFAPFFQWLCSDPRKKLQVGQALGDPMSFFSNTEFSWSDKC